MYLSTGIPTKCVVKISQPKPVRGSIEYPRRKLTSFFIDPCHC